MLVVNIFASIVVTRIITSLVILGLLYLLNFSIAFIGCLYPSLGSGATPPPVHRCTGKVLRGQARKSILDMGGSVILSSNWLGHLAREVVQVGTER